VHIFTNFEEEKMFDRKLIVFMKKLTYVFNLNKDETSICQCTVFILYSIWGHIENPKYKLICQVEMFFKIMANNPLLCLFYYVLTTIQSHFKK